MFVLDLLSTFIAIVLFITSVFEEAWERKEYPGISHSEVIVSLHTRFQASLMSIEQDSTVDWSMVRPPSRIHRDNSSILTVRRKSFRLCSRKVDIIQSFIYAA